MADIYTSRIAAARTIGAGEVKAESIAGEIFVDLPTSFDHTARGAITGAIHAYLTGTDDKGSWPAVATGPKGEQVRTNYGRGVDAIGRQLRKLFAGSDEPKPAVMRVSLSGEGGGSVVIDADVDAELYAVLLGRIAGI